MSIQSNINQGISLISLLRSQNPEVRHKAEVNRAKKNVDKAIETENIALEAYEKAIDNPKITDAGLLETPEYETYTEAGNRVLAAEEKLMELDPTPETHKNILARRREAGEQREVIEETRRKAAERLALEQERLAISRDITSVLTETPTPRTAKEQASYLDIIKKAKTGGGT